MYDAVKPIHTAYNDAFSSHARGAAIYGAVSRRMSTQDSADAKMLAYRNLLQHAAQIELLCGMLHPSTYDDAVCVNVLNYNVAVHQGVAIGA